MYIKGLEKWQALSKHRYLLCNNNMLIDNNFSYYCCKGKLVFLTPQLNSSNIGLVLSRCLSLLLAGGNSVVDNVRLHKCLGSNWLSRRFYLSCMLAWERKEMRGMKTSDDWMSLWWLNSDGLLWQVQLSLLTIVPQSERSPVRFPVRAHAWVAGQVPSGGCVGGNYTMMFFSLSLSPSLPLSLKNK